ncbi:MAG: hypothetical protein NT154_36315 [Verrucomicrobia bacterium]|nr:hypothetical protein [Verrucomicrobiota bacterium]
MGALISKRLQLPPNDQSANQPRRQQDSCNWAEFAASEIPNAADIGQYPEASGTHGSDIKFNGVHPFEGVPQFMQKTAHTIHLVIGAQPSLCDGPSLIRDWACCLVSWCNSLIARHIRVGPQMSGSVIQRRKFHPPDLPNLFIPSLIQFQLTAPG